MPLFGHRSTNVSHPCSHLPAGTPRRTWSAGTASSCRPRPRHARLDNVCTAVGAVLTTHRPSGTQVGPAEAQGESQRGRVKWRVGALPHYRRVDAHDRLATTRRGLHCFSIRLRRRCVLEMEADLPQGWLVSCVRGRWHPSPTPTPPPPPPKIGIKCPIVAGYMPIQSFATFQKLSSWCRSHIPTEVSRACNTSPPPSPSHLPLHPYTSPFTPTFHYHY